MIKILDFFGAFLCFTLVITKAFDLYSNNDYSSEAVLIYVLAIVFTIQIIKGLNGPSSTEKSSLPKP